MWIAPGTQSHRTFRLNPDAESILLRYHGHLDGREPLPAMAYFCLTVLEAKTGGRESAARAYRIEKAVLNRMGELTSLRGDRLTARKATGVQPVYPEEWALKALEASGVPDSVIVAMVRAQ